MVKSTRAVRRLSQAPVAVFASLERQLLCGYGHQQLGELLGFFQFILADALRTKKLASTDWQISIESKTR
jgi:hypothetical protein